MSTGFAGRPLLRSSERIKYLTRGEGYGGNTTHEAALEHFVLTMERIAKRKEVGVGRARLLPTATADRGDAAVAVLEVIPVCL